jgi:ectoine hydroxylase-related dioxygenase (phytanoyl-CoA dioxygenase family)
MQATSTLTEAQKQRFEDDGYMVMDLGLPLEVIDAALKDISGIYPPSPVPKHEGPPYPTRLQDAWKLSRNVHRIAVAPRVVAALRELYHREPLPFQTLNFPVGTQQFAHSDTIHFNSAPAGFMAGAWVAMEDMDMDNGPLMYYPGSHKLPEYTMAHVGVPAVASNYPKYEEFMQRVIRDFDLKPDYGTIKKGQVFIWSANLIHGGSMMRQPLRSRHSQVTHFYFKGCRYYTPLDTEGTKVYWRQPEWIPLV